MEGAWRCPGMRDLLPEEMERFRWVENIFRDVCLAWGYQEVRTPTVEHLFLFTAAGTLSPQLLGRVYSFLDWDGWSGERVVLRPDNTIPTARLYVENFPEGSLAKLFYVQSVFRFGEGDREEWQCGVEILGDTQPLGDLEVILLGREILTRLGVEGKVYLAHSGLIRAVLGRTGLAPVEQMRLYDSLLEGQGDGLAQLAKLLPQLGPSVASLLQEEGEGAAFVRNLRSVLAPTLPEVEAPLRELEALATTLEYIGMIPLVKGIMARNFEYYTGPMVEFWAEGGLVGAGGRYDSLVQLLCGRQVPACGFAFYLGRLLSLARPPTYAHGQPLMVEALEKSPEVMAKVFTVAQRLRERGIPVRVALGSGDLLGQGSRLQVRREELVLFPPGGVVGERLGSVEDVIDRLGQGGAPG